MADIELQARDLALRERQLDLEERKMAESRRTTFVDWLKGLGLPIASLVASIAVFVVQAQQQSFERALNSVRDGYKMYFDSVAQIDLKTVDDYYKAKRVLETTSKIYPEVFCGARNDLVTRIMSASMDVDRAPLMAEINELPAPDPSAGLTQPKWIELAWLQPRLPQCSALPKAGPADAAPAPVQAAPSPQASVATEKSAGKAADGAPSADKAASPAPATAAPEATPARAYRVFMQIGPTRDRDSFEAMRDEAAGLGFRLAGAEKMRRPILRGEVRYFGAEQEADAVTLAKFMTAKFASEGIAFQTQPIGKMFPNLPQDTMEVWIPDTDKAALDAVTGKALDLLQRRGRPAPSATPSP